MNGARVKLHRSCPYCGHRSPCRYSCRNCADLAREEMRLGLLTRSRRRSPAPREPMFAAVCGRCGDLNEPGAFYCAGCGLGLYLDPRAAGAIPLSAVGKTKGVERVATRSATQPDAVTNASGQCVTTEQHESTANTTTRNRGL